MRAILLSLTVTFTLTVAGLAQADTLLEGDVPVNIVEALLGENEIYSDIFDEFPDFDLPDGIVVLASTNSGMIQRVVLQAGEKGDDARLALINAFTANDWIEIAELPLPQTGFVNEAPIITSSSLCHDELGNLSFSSAENTQGNIFTLMRIVIPQYARQPSCEEQNARQNRMFGRRGAFSSNINQYMPRMEMPQTASQTMPNVGRGLFSSSDRSAETSTFFSIEWSLDEIYDYFSQQVSAQGWELDVNWSGSVTAGGSWTKSPESGLELLGTLDIINSSENSYEMKFKLLSIENNN